MRSFHSDPTANAAIANIMREERARERRLRRQQEQKVPAAPAPRRESPAAPARKSEDAPPGAFFVVRKKYPFVCVPRRIYRNSAERFRYYLFRGA